MFIRESDNVLACMMDIFTKTRVYNMILTKTKIYIK